MLEVFYHKLLNFLKSKYKMCANSTKNCRPREKGHEAVAARQMRGKLYLIKTIRVRGWCFGEIIAVFCFVKPISYKKGWIENKPSVNCLQPLPLNSFQDVGQFWTSLGAFFTYSNIEKIGLTFCSKILPLSKSV